MIKGKNINKERIKNGNDAGLWCQWQKKCAAWQKGQDSDQTVLLQYRGGDNRYRHIGNNTDEVKVNQHNVQPQKTTMKEDTS